VYVNSRRIFGVRNGEGRRFALRTLDAMEGCEYKRCELGFSSFPEVAF